MKRFLPLITVLLLAINPLSAQDSCSLRISLLTCAPGNEVYTTWGHTAIRVYDKSTGDDYVFNYGTFEFTPDFNQKFIKGNLLYSLSVQEFTSFIKDYRMESRSVLEQELQATCEEKQNLYNALQLNAEGNNRFYLYNFLYDNCTTRARDIIIKSMKDQVLFQRVLPDPIPTFRNLIHQYLDKQNEYWTKLGIDILLGARLDINPTNMQGMFLPDYLLKGLNDATVRNQLLVSRKVIILSRPDISSHLPFLLRPMPAFIIVLGLLFLLVFTRNPALRKAMAVFDFVFFLLLGAAGIFLLFMWFGTDHKECRDNYNLLWALPTNLVMAFFVNSNKAFALKYFRIVFVISLLLLAIWFILPQQMNNALLPLVILIIFRSWYLSKSSHGGKKSHI